MRLASRVAKLGGSATAAVFEQAKRLAAAGADLVDLSVGEPDFPSPPVAIAAAKAALDAGLTRYTPTAGLPELRGAIAATYGARHGSPWGTAETLVTVGAKMALYELAQGLFEPGDEVVLSRPCWVSLPEQIRLAGATPVFVDARAADGFALDPQALLAAVTPRTRALLVNAPANPTGAVLGHGAFGELAAACADRGLALISDETYERYVYDGLAPASAAAWASAYPETVIVVGSCSKTWAMTGWRIGWTLGPRALIAALANLQSHATSNPTSFAMAGALAALGEDEAAWQNRLAELAARRQAIVEGLDSLPGMRCALPAGAFYSFPEVRGLYAAERRDDAAIARWFLEEAGVVVVPGSAFGQEGHVRVSFAAGRERIAEAINRLARLLARG